MQQKTRASGTGFISFFLKGQGAGFPPQLPKNEAMQIVLFKNKSKWKSGVGILSERHLEILKN